MDTKQSALRATIAAETEDSSLDQDGSLDQAMTELTRKAIERAHAFVAGVSSNALAPELSAYARMFTLAREFAEALVELSNRERPFFGDTLRVDQGEYVRASGDAICITCGTCLYEHPSVPGYPWLHRRCDGALVKL